MPDVNAFDALPTTPSASALPFVPSTRPVEVDDASLVHAVYLATPAYFELISIPLPTVAEVGTEIAAALADERRRVELILGHPAWYWPGLGRDRRSDRPVIGYLDYKLDYPERGDATVNLLLIHGSLQARGLGAQVVADLERRLPPTTRRVLASIYGSNPSARRFWEGLGYRFALDARPVLEWYAKELRP